VHRREGQRLIVDENGALVLVDPDLAMLPVIQEFDDSFRVRQEPLWGFSAPRVMTTAATGSGLALASLASATRDDLWRAHEAPRRVRGHRGEGEASLLEVKVEIARRMLRKCELCGLRCAVNRATGERGRCGLGQEALVYESYVHIAEEPPINPSLNVALRGCGLRCVFCQQSRALQVGGPEIDLLGSRTWAQLDLHEARSLSFVGGNPTESLPAVLAFLASAPSTFALPVVWNSAGYDSVEAVRLLDGVCDAFIPDCKYGNNGCAAALSKVRGYMGVVRAAIEEMCRQAVPVFVRILVLPGHVRCCHLPSLELLAPWRKQLRLNVLSQYMPDFQVQFADADLARQVSPEEVSTVRNAAEDAGFDVMRLETVAAA
jgi:putative pyruvate formate lyase activating enzyme